MQCSQKYMGNILTCLVIIESRNLFPRHFIPRPLIPLYWYDTCFLKKSISLTWKGCFIHVFYFFFSKFEFEFGRCPRARARARVQALFSDNTFHREMVFCYQNCWVLTYCENKFFSITRTICSNSERSEHFFGNRILF